MFSKDRIYKLYIHTNIKNNKKYVGITRLEPVSKRWRRGSTYKRNAYFYRAIKKYGWDGFRHDVIFYNLTKEEAEFLEIEVIKHYKTTNNKFGYNIEHGGNGKGRITEETRKKQSKVRKGKKLTIEHKEKLSKIFSGKNNPMYGTISPNRKKVICIETGKIYNSIKDASIENNIDSSSISSVCNKTKYNNSVKGLHWAYYEDWIINDNPEDHIRIHSQYKSVICVETGKIYKNISDASRDIGVKGSGISNCCKGKFQTSGGFHWRYCEDYIKNPETPIYIKKIINARKVICIDTKEVFNSIKEASFLTGVCTSSISACCRKINSTAGGLRWKYLD